MLLTKKPFTVVWYIDNTEYTYFISFNEKNILHEPLRNGDLIFEREKVISLNGETLDIFTGFEKVSAFYHYYANRYPGTYF